MAAASSTALAAPYAITYTGTIQSSTITEAIAGQTYTVTFVFDNGGSTANSQTWNGSQLTCTLWRMNDARNVVYEQNLSTTPPDVALGAVTSDAGGALTGVFSDVQANSPGIGVPAGGAYTATGFSPVPPFWWYANNVNPIFADSGGGMRQIRDSAGGLQMDIAHWSAPVPFSGSCAAPAAPVAGNATAVPALGGTELALLSALVAGAGMLRRRKLGLE